VLVARTGEPERLPDPQEVEIAGVSLPTITIDPFPLSAPEKLGRALALFDGAANRRI